MDETVDRALRVLEAQSPELGRLAKTAYDALTMGAGPDTITQNDLQEHLWYVLGCKVLAPLEDKLDLARALGRLLDLMGLPRYAAICLSPTTAQVLEAWERRSGEGFKAFRRAQEESGLEPPDLEDFRWGQVMGIHESIARDGVSARLELAVAAGELRPGERGWRAAQRRIAGEYLYRPVEEMQGRSPMDTVLAERVGRWADGHRPLRAAILSPVLAQVLDPVDPPAGVERAMEPLSWLLGEAAGGIALTQKGNLGRDFVRAAWPRFREDDFPFVPRGEDDVFRLQELHALAREISAVRRSGRRLVATRAGRGWLQDPVGLWRAVARRFTEGTARRWEAAVAELALAAVLGESPRDREALEIEIRNALAEVGWRVEGPGSPPPDERVVGRALLDLLGPGGTLGMFELGKYPDRSVALTDVGRATAREALRAVAAGPWDDPRLR